MNDLQNSYAAADNSLGHLLVQVDTFYQDLPEPVRKAFDALGSTTKLGCQCGLEEEVEIQLVKIGADIDGVYYHEVRPTGAWKVEYGQLFIQIKSWLFRHWVSEWDLQEIPVSRIGQELDVAGIWPRIRQFPLAALRAEDRT